MALFARHFFENIKCAWERADAKNTSSPGTFYGYFESAWYSADVKKFSYLHSLSLLMKCYDLLLLTNFAKLVIIYAFLSHFGKIL